MSQTAKIRPTENDPDQDHTKKVEARAVAHASDCALHNAPAYKAGACTCGAVKDKR
jgi:hypothetical protein